MKTCNRKRRVALLYEYTRYQVYMSTLGTALTGCGGYRRVGIERTVNAHTKNTNYQVLLYT